ncbi:hypothetical protein N658DRAFT_502028 [Parathielavia hyrcaniae]|uniref:Uncharacterized protein n=1 Tax=Parathielavia hyrcaniae TaxID=113614 RepID=A0AAN6PQG1_9PEZI|nr:hypothetical protein N658DRAFT_502028 [Parathielavia hyrcaniae]
MSQDYRDRQQKMVYQQEACPVQAVPEAEKAHLNWGRCCSHLFCCGLWRASWGYCGKCWSDCLDDSC